MQQSDEQTEQGPPRTPATTTANAPRRRGRRIATPKQILNSTNLCARFEQISGQGLPKRLTTGKFVFLGPADRLPESPL